MDRKIRVGAVSYLNTKPLIYGFEKGMMEDSIELSIDYPAKVAEALINDMIDIGLVPVAIIPELKEYHIIGNHCIACDGAVASVCLFSNVPLKEITTVLLDYQSRTSVLLAQILIKEYWKIIPKIIHSNHEFFDQIEGSTAAVVIGDRALELRNKFEYIYDLGLAWKEFTGFPFVFAAWVSNKILSDDFQRNFDKANQYGLDNITEVLKNNPYSIFDLEKYYEQYIKFIMKQDMNESIQLFLKKASDSA